MEATQFKVQVQEQIVPAVTAEEMNASDEAIREISALELSLVGGGCGIVTFV